MEKLSLITLQPTFHASLWNFYLLLKLWNVSASPYLLNKILTQPTIIDGLLYARCYRYKDEWDTVPVRPWVWISTLIWGFYNVSRWSCSTSSWLFRLKLRSNTQNLGFNWGDRHLLCSPSGAWNTPPRTKHKVGRALSRDRILRDVGMPSGREGLRV